MPTNTTIAITTTATNNDTAPSVRSARWSGHGSRRRFSTRGSGDRDPLRRDDPASRRRFGNPADERRGGARRPALRHLVEARDARVLPRDRVRLVAGDAADADEVESTFFGLVVG